MTKPKEPDIYYRPIREVMEDWVNPRPFPVTGGGGSVHSKYHDTWIGRVAEALDCTAHGDKGKHGDAPKRCVECQMIIDTDTSLRAALAAKEAAEAEVVRLREAVEWACEDMRQNDVIPYDTKRRLINELRRRAGKEGT